MPVVDNMNPTPNIPQLEDLVRNYPIIFRAYRQKRRYAYPIAFWGFEIGVGWYAIIDQLSAWLEREARIIKASEKCPPAISQVKQKFGVLHLGLQHYPKDKVLAAKIDQRIDAIERKSALICEVCGHAGKRRPHLSMATLCDLHTEEYERKDSCAYSGEISHQ